MPLRLKKFNIREIKNDSVVILGRKKSGKSFLCRDILFHRKNDLPVGTVISYTEGITPFYSKILPPLFIHEEYSAQIIDKVLKRQKMCLAQIQKDIESKGRSTIDPKAFLILDDCLYNESWQELTGISSAIVSSYHLKLLTILIMSYIMDIPPKLRTNIDYVFILKDNNVNNRRKIYDNYANIFPSFDEFSQVMDVCTDDNECIVINNNAKGNEIEDQAFWYKADSHADFRIGAPEIWEMHNRNYNNNDDEDDYASQRSSRSKLIRIKPIH
jgi:hypothetical protein